MDGSVAYQLCILYTSSSLHKNNYFYESLFYAQRYYAHLAKNIIINNDSCSEK